LLKSRVFSGKLETSVLDSVSPPLACPAFVWPEFTGPFPLVAAPFCSSFDCAAAIATTRLERQLGIVKKAMPHNSRNHFLGHVNMCAIILAVRAFFSAAP
jgi:hypothetical protein